jgi:colicin import membrane protein
VESPGAEQPHVGEGTPRDCLEKTVVASVGQTERLEEAPPEPVVLPLNEEGLAENHAAEAMDTEGKMSAEIRRLLDAEDRAHAEKTSKEQEEAARAKEQADAEARARDDVKEKARKKQEEVARARANADAAKKAAKKEKKASKKAAERENAPKDRWDMLPRLR